RCAGVSRPGASTACRFSLMSRAGSEMDARSSSTAFMSSDLDRFLSLAPVAGAELIGLQCIEHAKRFGDAAADGENVHVHPADRPFRIDDERGAKSDAGILADDAELLAERGRDVDQRGVDLLQIVVRITPGEVRELVVGGAADD